MPRLKLLGGGQASPGTLPRAAIWDWADLSEALRKLADAVVVEAGPVLSSADGLRFIRGSDAVVITIDQQRSTRSTVDRAALELGRAGATVLGCVVSGETRRRRGPLGLLGRRRRRRSEAAYRRRVEHLLAAPPPTLVDQQHLAPVQPEPESRLPGTRRSEENGTGDIDPQLLREGKD